MKEKQLYPSWRYHQTEPACIVETADAHEALGDGWQDSPFSPEAPQTELVDVTPDLAVTPDPAIVAIQKLKNRKKAK